MMTISSGRRGFLRTFALAIGAFLVGVGRTGSAADQHCGYCRDRCPERACPSGTPHSLAWRAYSDKGWCVECYASADAVAEAVESGEGCNYCGGIVCGYFQPDNIESDDDDGDEEEEDYHSEDEEENWLESLDEEEWD